MGLLSRQPKTPEQQAQKARDRFFATPAGQARSAFERGDQVFQCSLDVVNQEAIMVVMLGGSTNKQQSDPTAILNEVCREGWELVNGDFVFVQEGQESRDKFMMSGQNVAIKGTVVGFYLFRRCEGNRADSLPEPWSQEEVQAHPPGWHPDPHNPARYRYWDGQQWTDHYSDQAPATQG